MIRGFGSTSPESEPCKSRSSGRSAAISASRRAVLSARIGGRSARGLGRDATAGRGSAPCKRHPTRAPSRRHPAARAPSARCARPTPTGATGRPGGRARRGCRWPGPHPSAGIGATPRIVPHRCSRRRNHRRQPPPRRAGRLPVPPRALRARLHRPPSAPTTDRRLGVPDHRRGRTPVIQLVTMAEVADAAEYLLANAGTKSKTSRRRRCPRRIAGNADART